MLRGVLPENEQTARELLTEAQSFLNELIVYYKDQMVILMGQAQAETQYVSAYVDKIGLQNLEHSLNRLQKLSLENDPRLGEKCLHYLQRTDEFLTKISQNSYDGAFFIPVPYHAQVAKEHAEQLEQCKLLVSRASKVIQPESVTAKSWFSKFLNLANILPDIRAAAWGLLRQNRQVEATERLHAIYDNLLALESKKDSDIVVTKTTRNALSIAGFTAEPSADSDYHELVPPLEPVIVSFKAFMEKQKQSQGALTKQDVLATVDTTFPKPVMK